MKTQVKVPAMGESVTSGILARWKVANGATVAKGQPIFDLETDKITSEGTAEVAGVISLTVAEGATVKIGDVVAEIEASAVQTDFVAAKPVTAAASAVAPVAKAEVKLAPSVERLAAETGVNPAAVAASGPKGNVVKADVLAAAGQLPSSTARRVKMTPLRKRVAERLVNAQHAAAMLTTFNEVDMSTIMSLRKSEGEKFLAKYGVKLGFMSFFVKATALALKAVPQITAQIDGEDLVYPAGMDIGVAVSTERGLMVPVLRGCDKMSFADVEKQLAELATKARDGKIGMDALQGGVFTITNGGIFGSMMSTPILNAPQSAILGMHAIKERAVVVDGAVVARPMMYLALSYDHRVVDGKEAVTTLVNIKNALEKPVELMGFGV